LTAIHPPYVEVESLTETNVNGCIYNFYGRATNVSSSFALLRSAMSLHDVDSCSKSQFGITQYSLIPVFIRGIYPETTNLPKLSPVTERTSPRTKARARSLSVEEPATMNIFHQRVVTFMFELLTSNDDCIRRSLRHQRRKKERSAKSATISDTMRPVGRTRVST